jgi:transposase
MKLISKKCIPKAIQIVDRFHVQKLALEALQEIKIKHRWDALDFKNQLIIKAKTEKKNTSHSFYPTTMIFKLYPDIITAFKVFTMTNILP